MKRMLVVHDMIQIAVGSFFGVAMCHLNEGEFAAPAVLIAIGLLLIWQGYRIVRWFSPKDGLDQ